MGLSAKERLFVNEYLATKSVTRAAIRAGFSKKSASSQGSQLLKKPNVSEEITKRQAKAANKADLKAADVLAELKKIAFTDLTQAFDKDGAMLPLHEMPDDVKKALIMVESDEILAGPRGLKRKIGHTRRLKIADKLRALEMLAKHFKLLTEVSEISGPNGGPQVIVNMPADGSEADFE